MNLKVKLSIVLLIIIIVLLINPTQKLAAEKLELNSQQDKYKLDDYIELLADKNNEWMIENVSSSTFDHKFREYTLGKTPNFGYNVDNFWVRIQLQNESQETDWFLELASPPMDYLTVYRVLSTGQFEKIRLGDLVPFKEKPVNHRHQVYRFQLEPGAQQIFYLHFQTEGPMEMPLTLWKSAAFMEKSQIEYILLGVFFGLVTIMAFYNLFLYISLRDKNYLLYVIYLIMYLMTQLSFYGIAYQFLWPNYSWWNHRAIIFFMALTHIFVLLFTMNFLSTKKFTPKLNYLLTALVITQLGILIILFAYSYVLALKLIIISVLILTIFVFSVTVICLKKGYRPARFFSLGWFLFLAGALTTSLMDAGVVPDTIITRYASPIGSAFEVICFSLALADRINIMRKEKEIAQAEERERAKELHNLNKNLEEIVSLRTKELEKAAKHLESVNLDLRRMETSRRNLFSNISHELGTPMTSIQGYVKAILDGIIPYENQHKYLTIVDSKAQLLNRLIHDLFELSKLEARQVNFKFDTIDAIPFLNDLYRKFEFDVRQEGIEYVFKVERNQELMKSPAVVSIDCDRIEQVFNNLIYNSIKYTPIDGVIQVRIHFIDQLMALRMRGLNKDCLISSLEEEVDHFVLIEIYNSGSHIHEDDLPLIFDRFYKGNNSAIQKDGNGLGLSIAKEIIEYHDGHIWARNQEGVGISFYFTLPLKKDIEE